MGKDSALVGKLGENYVLSVFLKRKYDVYAPIADVNGIDFIVRTKNGDYKEIQVKTRDPDKGNNFDVEFEYLNRKSNYYVACFFLNGNEIWIIPAEKFLEINTLKPEDGYGRAVVRIGPRTRDKFEDFLDNYEQLE